MKFLRMTHPRNQGLEISNMSTTRPAPNQFRSRIARRDHVLGTFIKTPISHPVEIIGQVGFDFVLIDQEHSPFDRMSVDIACLAARAWNTAAVVRVAEATPANILSVLDCGATGIMVPHVDTPEKAAVIAASCRYRKGSRGFANTTRAGSFGSASFEDHMAAQDAEVTCIAMIEDVQALTYLPAIAAIEGIDAFFIGRGDLTAALGVDRMNEAVKVITSAARVANMPTMALVSSKEDAKAMAALGVSAFVYSNDHNLLRMAAIQALRDFGDPSSW
jgi:staphyloferrin B biosynthesis citrate synthase